jgi:hypothetical protein
MSNEVPKSESLVDRVLMTKSSIVLVAGEMEPASVIDLLLEPRSLYIMQRQVSERMCMLL